MRKLLLVPEKPSYSESWGPAATSTRLEGGASLFGPTAKGTPRRLEVTWVVESLESSYLQAFLRLVGRVGEPFLVDLPSALVGLVPTEHQAWVVPGTVRLGRPRGETHDVSCQLLVALP